MGGKRGREGSRNGKEEVERKGRMEGNQGFFFLEKDMKNTFISTLLVSFWEPEKQLEQYLIGQMAEYNSAQNLFLFLWFTLCLVCLILRSYRLQLDLHIIPYSLCCAHAFFQMFSEGITANSRLNFKLIW